MEGTGAVSVGRDGAWFTCDLAPQQRREGVGELQQRDRIQISFEGLVFAAGPDPVDEVSGNRRRPPPQPLANLVRQRDDGGNPVRGGAEVLIQTWRDAAHEAPRRLEVPV